MKSKVDKLDVEQLVPVPVDLSKLRNVVKMILLKKMYLMSRLKILKIKYQIYIYNLATNACLNAKINEVKGEIPNITNLATTLTAVENNIANVSNLVKKTDYNTNLK